MANNDPQSAPGANPEGAILAIDGGGTRTRAGLYTPDGTLLAEAEGDATNLSTNPESLVIFTIAGLAEDLTTQANQRIATVVAGISGAGRTGRAQVVATGLAKAIETSDVAVCSDAHMLSWANLDSEHPILVIAGTGSAVIARRANGSRVVTGGYGPIVGDEGGAYRLALEGIKRADEDDALQKTLLNEVKVGTLPELYHWVEDSRPSNIAHLATVVIGEGERGNSGALAAIRDQAQRLADLTMRGLARAGHDVRTLKERTILITGGLSDAPFYIHAFTEAVSKKYGEFRVEPPQLYGHRAALELLRLPSDAPFIGRPKSIASTERIESPGLWLDRMDPSIISLALALQDKDAATEVAELDDLIGDVIVAAAACIRAGGRIVYAGAGTSGRLGVLDASECPPTFGVGEDRVIALIAGGDAALRHSIEGAEDDTAAATRDIDTISPRVGANDIVIGITASGTTPYALAAIDRAKHLGAKTGLVACNPVPLDRADFVVALDTGPEVLPGSTRLKAGTATKLVLNQISTGAMAKAGYVFEGRMVGVRPLNKKLRQRCIRIIAELTKEDAAAAEKRLDETGGSIRLAVLMARRGLTLEDARRRLDAARGVLRDALEAK